MAIKFIPNMLYVLFSHTKVRAMPTVNENEEPFAIPSMCNEKNEEESNERKKRRQLTRPIYFHFMPAPRYANRIRILIYSWQQNGVCARARTTCVRIKAEKLELVLFEWSCAYWPTTYRVEYRLYLAVAAASRSE